jgi:hypothetical protein
VAAYILRQTATTDDFLEASKRCVDVFAWIDFHGNAHLASPTGAALIARDTSEPPSAPLNASPRTRAIVAADSDEFMPPRTRTVAVADIVVAFWLIVGSLKREEPPALTRRGSYISILPTYDKRLTT